MDISEQVTSRGLSFELELPKFQADTKGLQFKWAKGEQSLILEAFSLSENEWKDLKALLDIIQGQRKNLSHRKGFNGQREKN